jgi:hypothetical protein
MRDVRNGSSGVLMATSFSIEKGSIGPGDTRLCKDHFLTQEWAFDKIMQLARAWIGQNVEENSSAA